MVFNWYHKVIVKYKYFRKSFSLEALEAAGSGSNLGFNYSHLEKQDKESLTEVVTWEWIVWLVIINQKNHSGSRSAGAHRRGPADFFPNSRKTSIQQLLEAQQHKKYAQTQTTPLDYGVFSWQPKLEG
jgi:hypothetical protein